MAIARATRSLALAFVLAACETVGPPSVREPPGPSAPLLPAPAAPSGLAASGQGPGSITLAWQDNSSDENAFKVLRRSAGTSEWSFASSLPAGTTAFVDFGLAASWQYEYCVRATKIGAEDSPCSNVASATTGEAPPGPTSIWSKGYHLGTQMVLPSAAEIQGGGYLVAATGQPRDDSGPTAGLLLRLRPDGELALGQAVGGTRAGGLHRLRSAGAGFVATGTTTIGSTAGRGWLVRLDAAGEVLWQRVHAAGLGATSLVDATVTADNDVIAAGATQGLYGDRLLLVKVAADGALMWSRSLASTISAASAVVLLPGGDVTVVGRAWNDDTGVFDLLALRVRGDGTSVWARRFAWERFSPVASDALATADGGLLVVGMGPSVADTNQAGYAAWVLRLDGEGRVSWSRRLDVGGHTLARAVVPTSVGFAVLGAVGEFPAADMWLVELDSSGVVTRQVQVGGSATEVGNSIAATADGGLLLFGASGSNGRSGNWGIKLPADRGFTFEPGYGLSAANTACIVDAALPAVASPAIQLPFLTMSQEVLFAPAALIPVTVTTHQGLAP